MLVKSIKNFIKKLLSPKHYPAAIDLQNVFLEKNNYLSLYDVSYKSLNDLKFTVKHILNSFSIEKKIIGSYIKKEKYDIYLTEFLFDKINGVSDYSDEVIRIKNDIIELELLLDYIENSNLLSGIIGSNYHIAKSILSDMYDVIDQLELASKRMQP
jgi:hypothetical protein